MDTFRPPLPPSPLQRFFAHSIVAKVLLLAALTILAALPLAQIHGLIEERGASRDRAAQDLAKAHAGAQTLTGPFLVVPYTERWTDETPAGKVARSREWHHVVFPERMALDGRLTAQERYRGIFTVLFYELKGSVAGSFAPFDPAALPRHYKDAQVEMGAPWLALSLSDVRGLHDVPAAQFGTERSAWLARVPGLPAESWLARGVHTKLPDAALQAFRQKQSVPFRVELGFVGQERFAVVPLADQNSARLVSDWAHPSFGGEFLALRRTVTPQGFEAEWSVSSLMSEARRQVQRIAFDAKAAEQGPRPDTFAVSLVEPLNVYALASRAVKYGLLFVGLTFLAAFMFELFRELRLHPIQYGLVGLSIVLFFLLLLALSEKIAFGLAYLVAAGASVLLLTVYFGAVLQGFLRGLGLGSYVAILYGALYVLLRSEDNALLLGSVLLFALLAFLMIATRRVDWFRVGRAEPALNPDAGAAG